VPNKTKSTGRPNSAAPVRFDSYSAALRGLLLLRAKSSGERTMATTPPIIQVGTATVLGLTVADSTGWFANYLPLAGSPALEAFIILGTAVVLQELAEIIRNLRGPRR
jgi:hypothetical protein